MKRILFVISYLDKGGSERALSNLTLNFPDDWEIDILVNNDKVIDYPYKANIISMNIDGKPRTGSVFFQFKVLLRRIKWLRRLKKEGNYDACISFLDSANIANIISGKKYCRTIVSVRNSLKKQASLPQYRYVVNPLVKLLYNRSNKIVACSKGIERELINIFKLKSNKICTIENGYDIHGMQEMSHEKLEEDTNRFIHEKKVIVNVGRLTDQKGQWHLIRAFSELKKDSSNVVLIIIGTGELEEYLKQLVKLYGIEDSVLFVGYTNNPFKYLKRADVFVMPSLYEGFPNALAEAVCLGIPCIATDFETGAREILAPEMDLSKEKILEIKHVSRGILVPLCSGKKNEYDVKLDKAENNLKKAMEQLLLEKKMYSRTINLDISESVNKWISVINEK